MRMPAIIRATRFTLFSNAFKQTDKLLNKRWLSRAYRSSVSFSLYVQPQSTRRVLFHSLSRGYFFISRKDIWLRSVNFARENPLKGFSTSYRDVKQQDHFTTNRWGVAFPVLSWFLWMVKPFQWSRQFSAYEHWNVVCFPIKLVRNRAKEEIG